MLINPFRCG
ncbi:hypothetical protein AYI69_g8374, partial [Smittium culicis]